MERLTYKSFLGDYGYKGDDWEKDRFKVCNRLGAYEQAEEDGLLLKLPCKIGDIKYVVRREDVSVLFVAKKCKIKAIRYDGTYFDFKCIESDGIISIMNIFDNCLFDTMEEAEARAKELNGE